MIIYGISANEHDAGSAVVREEDILFASHAERYSHLKNDAHLNPGLISDARKFGKPDLIVWYERPCLKRARKLLSGQYNHGLRSDGAAYLERFGFDVPIRYVGHHECHAAAGYFSQAHLKKPRS